MSLILPMVMLQLVLHTMIKVFGKYTKGSLPTQVYFSGILSLFSLILVHVEKTVNIVAFLKA